MKPCSYLPLANMAKVVECVPIDEIYSPEVISILQVGSCHRLTFGTADGDGDGTVLIRLVAKIVLTDEALHALVSGLQQYIAIRKGKSRPHAVSATT
jgi:hypothetical protein